MMELPNKPFVKVTWHDAADYKEKGWVSEEELRESGFVEKPVVCISLGWLLSKRGGITIASDYSPPIRHDDKADFGRVTKIPRKMVVSIEEVKLLEGENSAPKL